MIPIILSSDKTQLTLFWSKQAYLVYFTIGNILKDIRRKPSQRTQILVSYIPVAKLQTLPSDAARRRAQANLFHFCVQTILGLVSCSHDY